MIVENEASHGSAAVQLSDLTAWASLQASLPFVGQFFFFLLPVLPISYDTSTQFWWADVLSFYCQIW